MHYTRREMLAVGTGGILHLTAKAADKPAKSPAAMGVIIHTYGIRKAADKEARFDDPLTFLEYCRSLGAGGVQTSLGVRDEAYAAKLRAVLEEHKLYLEGSLALPRSKDDLDRFAAEVRTVKACGATVFRTVFMNGRRYEVFDSAEAFHKFHAQAKQSLALARPIVEKYQVRMAIENHKDLRAPELVEIIEKQDSPLIGVCVDTGNNIALLESPKETLELLAPHALTTHIKDMGLAEYAEGFLLAEVPLGTGSIDLPGTVARLRKANPDIRLNLEMITRDPLKVPVLTGKYWVTQENVPGRKLAEMLAAVRARADKLPRVSELKKAEQIRREDDNVRQSLRYARVRLA